MSPSLMDAATRGPQVETLGDAFARMQQRRNAEEAARIERQLQQQQLTLGGINLARSQQQQADEQLERQIMMQGRTGSQPPQAQQPHAPQLQPEPVPVTYENGAQVTRLAPQQPQQPAPPAEQPQPPAASNRPDMEQRTISALREKGLWKQADAMEAAALERRTKKGLADSHEATTAKANAEAKAAKEAADHTAMYQATGYLLGLPDDATREAEFPTVMKQLADAGHLDAQHASLTYQNYGGSQALQRDHQTMGKRADLDAEAKEKREAALFPSQKLKAEYDAVAAGADSAMKARAKVATDLAAAAAQGKDALEAALDALPRGVTKQFEGARSPGEILARGLTAEQQTQATATAARDANTAKNEAAMRGQGQARLNLEREKAGFDMNGGVSPAAQMAADGRMSPSTLKAMLRGNKGLIGQIQKIDPKFDEANIQNRYDTLKEFTSTANGKAGGQALALNTLIHHADLYMQTAEALKNGSFVPGNKVYNAVVSTFGSAPPANANLVARFFAGETGKVATGGVPAEGEINGILKNLGNSASPDQIAGAGNTLLQIAAGRATPLIERAKQAKIDGVVQVLGPDATEILGRRGFDANMKPVVQGNKQTAAKPSLDSFWRK